ncbi:MAG TPA: DUF5947 family protein [Bryobacteraceae bacterium]|nr:DUF5947 family protein [Bryobacteraceae bacterium]
MSTALSSQNRSFATLRRFVERRPEPERCHMCSTELARGHQHLLELATRRLVCACDPCALLFPSRRNGKYKQVPRRIRILQDFRLSDGQWDSLMIPIGIAFLFESSRESRMTALYPSPAGAVESLLSLDAWNEIAEENPVLAGMEPDVEALLVNRLGDGQYYLTPIDRCYQLVGLIRTHWRGLSGGSEMWEETERFFRELRSLAGA